MAASPIELGNLKFSVPGKTKFYLKLNIYMIWMVLKDLNPLFRTVKIQCTFKVITYDFDNSNNVTKIIWYHYVWYCTKTLN